MLQHPTGRIDLPPIRVDSFNDVTFADSQQRELIRIVKPDQNNQPAANI